eukprot:CAMPEP_0184289028 /NCGR_PEP_ID=MMETSP1049-20130417/1514_1 /TAXON_ID=77928 /ORGANISM="Proteomonas sulcata, Strain CCMP704" /LENGTH=96 /DNA_ID=CAMNT_0026595669 /DNA_START=103 /DNA_END=389 /DNA_ORIENTATION=-
MNKFPPPLLLSHAEDHCPSPFWVLLRHLEADVVGRAALGRLVTQVKVVGSRGLAIGTVDGEVSGVAIEAGGAIGEAVLGVGEIQHLGEELGQHSCG